MHFSLAFVLPFKLCYDSMIKIPKYSDDSYTQNAGSNEGVATKKLRAI